ncbi:hypothetical protein WP50_01755 [Lactiplantibacillus plantarum]|nr:hypothetical protein WP50_01755 [Lactiplantibacillus plantarum]
MGTLHGTIESDYIQDDPEIKLDTTGISYLGVYGPDDNGAHSATQYMARLSNGQYLTSRARDDSGSSDTMFALQDSKFAVQSVMLQIHGQHGGTFGVQEVNNTIYIWSIVSLKNDGNYILVRFPYVAGVTLLGEYTTVQVATPAWMEQYQNALSKAVDEAKKDASSIKPVALTPDGNNFTDTTQTKRLILQAWEGSTNISSYIDSKGFIWRRYNTD